MEKNYSTTPQVRQAVKNWKLKNPEKVKEHQKRALKNWRLKNPDAWKAIQKRAYLKRKEKEILKKEEKEQQETITK